MDLYLTNSLVQVKPVRTDASGQGFARSKKDGQSDETKSSARSSLPALIANTSSFSQTQLVRDETETTQDGFRRQQEFETGTGRTFSRNEDFSTNENSARRLVVQRNVSGSITSLEEVTDRLADGSFRKTSRFTDETGHTQTKIEVDLTAAEIGSSVNAQTPKAYRIDYSAEPPRGNRLDVHA